MPARKRINGMNGSASSQVGAATLEIPSSPAPAQSRGPVGGGFDASVSPAMTNSNVELFSSEQLEMLSFRRFNPFASFNAAGLGNALDSYLAGYLVPAARLWERLAKQQKTIRNVKAKREEAVALRPRVIERTDDSPMAYDQAFVLENFYNNARAGHALNRNVRGGFSKLVMQMMEAKSFGTAAHHLIWNPDSSRLITLPSGAKVPSLTARFEYVPMEFFESRTGELRFLGMSQAYSGEPLAESAWLITSEESPLMFAASVLAYYDKLATSDNINFSEKFGTPGLVVHTTAQKNSPEGEAAFALTKTLGSNYRGTLYGAAENKVEIVWPSGGTSGTSLPMHQIIEDVKRDLASLYLGADLSTQSRGGSEKSVGASVQQEGEERRERADCAWISETLNAGIDATVLRWYFGDAPVLARVSIDAPKNEDRTVLANLVGEMVSLGAQVPIEPVMKRLNVPLAKKGEELVFTAPAVAETPLPGGPSIATNVLDHGELNLPLAKRGITDAQIDQHLKSDRAAAEFSARELRKRAAENKAEALRLLDLHGDALAQRTADKHGVKKSDALKTLKDLIKTNPEAARKLLERAATEHPSENSAGRWVTHEGHHIFIKDGDERSIEEIAKTKNALATNVRSGDADLEKFLGPLRDDYLKAFANDLQPLRSAMESVIAADSGPSIGLSAKLMWLQSQLPALLTEINAAPKSADVLEQILKKSFERGVAQSAAQTQAA